MTEKPVTLEELLQTREDLVGNIVGQMPAEHRRFLISAKRGQPDWTLLDLPGAESLPAVLWRLRNLAKLQASKRSQLLAGLREVLGIPE